MTILETAKITSKGQITLPNRIRKLLHLREGELVGFSVTKQGVVLVACEMTAKSHYTARQWAKIEKMSLEKGKMFTSAQGAKDHLKSL